MMSTQMLINDIKSKFTELAPNKEISYNTTASIQGYPNLP